MAEIFGMDSENGKETGGWFAGFRALRVEGICVDIDDELAGA